MSELDKIVVRLRHELGASGVASEDGLLGPLPSRRRADRLWAVTAERPYLARPGPAGRVRGAALMPLKAILRRAMRWYVEPLATDQREFNATVLRLVDEQHRQILQALERLEERVSALEQRGK
jgi:hypothetical protein